MAIPGKITQKMRGMLFCEKTRIVRTERGCVGLPTSRSAVGNTGAKGEFAAAAASSSSLRSSEHSRAPKKSAARMSFPHHPPLIPRIL
jgi:hypothetical protein